MKSQVFSESGDGWFQTHLGCSASDFVARLRKARRTNKSEKTEIDDIISDIRTLKAIEVDQTLALYPWAKKHESTIKALGVNEKDLKNLRKFGDVRKVSFIRACNQWEEADTMVKTLENYDDVWSEDQRDAWVKAMDSKKDARKMWKSALHQVDRLTDKEMKTLKKSADLLTQKGPMSSRAIFENMVGTDDVHWSMTPMKLSKLLNMYGEEIDIINGAKRGTFVKMDGTGLIIKDPFAYAAGFLDADGYITITKRGEPRAGFIATGTRGRVHCEELRKVLDCGVLQLDQKVYKDTQRSQHRLQFYSKDDIGKLLKRIEPHLKMKKKQAKAVMSFINEKDNKRKGELKMLVQYLNWEDDTKKATSLLTEWGVDADTVNKWSEGL